MQVDEKVKDKNYHFADDITVYLKHRTLSSYLVIKLLLKIKSFQFKNNM